MLLIAALSLSLFNHLPRLPVLGHARAQARQPYAARLPARVGPWRIEGRLDRFAGTRVCAISADGVSLHRDTLVFRVEARGDTRQALFRIDGGAPRPVADAFDTDEANGVFPQRGWIIDPEGGEAALPAAYASGARMITIRSRVGRRPRHFNIARLDDAVVLAKASGCAAVIP
jgi:hypothetical protein